jgi:hypothetical protein
MIQDLGKLGQLDLVDVSKQERMEAGYSVSSSEDDEDGDEEEEEDEKGGGDQNPGKIATERYLLNVQQGQMVQ